MKQQRQRKGIIFHAHAHIDILHRAEVECIDCPCYLSSIYCLYISERFESSQVDKQCVVEEYMLPGTHNIIINMA